MGSDRVRYLVFSYGRWRWKPTRTMRAAGFRPINFGSSMTAADTARVIALNGEWDQCRRGQGASPPRYPRGSLGEAYVRAMALRAKQRAGNGIVWSSEQHSRDDWPRAWKWIEPVLGDCDPRTVTPEMMVELRLFVATEASETEAHRLIKVWRVLWKYAAVFGYCAADRDPTFAIVNSAPQPRQHTWREGEAVRLVKCSWRAGYHGLAALLAVAWDTQLSPVDARGLRADQRQSDHLGTWFEVARAKTGRGAKATLSKRALRLLAAYEGVRAAEPIGGAPIFRNRSGRAYTKDTLGDDFRTVRAMVFGRAERRQLADFRRSGTVEALVGQVDPLHLSSKMANSIATSNRLSKTYAPATLAANRAVDKARVRGRQQIRAGEGARPEQKPHESPRSTAAESQNRVQESQKSPK